ncbi:MAG: hypothetical protein A2Y25_08965 [Candidatus Melainabacteria bacterium GWF2_37_15]|nr:MAG: hypothetical protein A2Y25_08965 [Candidatus Melainabacteria bacterium GWF2_37_15]
MQQNLTDKIYLELDMIRFLSRITRFAITNKTENLQEDSLPLVFDDIEKRCWQISEMVEKLDNTP